MIVRKMFWKAEPWEHPCRLCGDIQVVKWELRGAEGAIELCEPCTDYFVRVVNKSKEEKKMILPMPAESVEDASKQLFKERLMRLFYAAMIVAFFLAVLYLSGGERW